MNFSEHNDAIATDVDLKTGRYLQLLKSDVHKNMEVIQDIKQHYLNVANTKAQWSSLDVLSIMDDLMKRKKIEINDKLRMENDKEVNKHIDPGIADMVSDVVIFEKRLALQTFALESPIAPIVIFATNRGRCGIRGTTDILSQHGIPLDMLQNTIIS